MAKTRRNTRSRRANRRANRRASRRVSGGGYQTSQQYLNPDILPPQASAFAPVVSTAPTADMIRPVLNATFKGGRRTRGVRRGPRHRGGFSPSVMGGFIGNAQAAIVPAALYMVYHTMVPKSGSKTRKTSRQ